MLDTVVLLTPLMVFIIALLLGFAGCGFSGSGPGELSAVVRVPMGLTVTYIQVNWIDPNNDPGTLYQQNPQSTGGVEDGNRVFLQLIEHAPASGDWSVWCFVTVRDSAGTSASSEAMGTFYLSYEVDDHRAQFLASGSPSDQTFTLSFIGAT